MAEGRVRDRIARAGLGPQVAVGVAVLMTVAFGIFGLLALRMTREGERELRVEREKLAEAFPIGAVVAGEGFAWA